MKVCLTCKERKKLSEFHKNKKSSDGKTNICKMCKQQYRQRYYLNNKQLELNNCKKYQNKNSDKLKQYRIQNTHISRKASSVWRKNHPELNRYKRAKERSIKLKATPKWANLNKIKEIYQNCPEGYHVDHIIPLRGKDVCGLHIETNLQYLSAIENLRKGNKVR